MLDQWLRLTPRNSSALPGEHQRVPCSAHLRGALEEPSFLGPAGPAECMFQRRGKLEEEGICLSSCCALVRVRAPWPQNDSGPRYDPLNALVRPVDCCEGCCKAGGRAGWRPGRGGAAGGRSGRRAGRLATLLAGLQARGLQYTLHGINGLLSGDSCPCYATPCHPTLGCNPPALLLALGATPSSLSL